MSEPEETEKETSSIQFQDNHCSYSLRRQISIDKLERTRYIEALTDNIEGETKKIQKIS